MLLLHHPRHPRGGGPVPVRGRHQPGLRLGDVLRVSVQRAGAARGVQHHPADRLLDGDRHRARCRAHHHADVGKPGDERGGVGVPVGLPWNAGVRAVGVLGFAAGDLSEHPARCAVRAHAGAVRSAVRFAFDNSNGSSSNYMVTDNGIAVFHILDKSASTYDDFNNNKDNIKRSLIGEKKKEYAKNILNNLSDDWKTATTNNSSIKLNQNEVGTLGQNFPTIGRSNDLLGLLLQTSSKGKINNVLESSTYVFLANINTIDNIEESLFESVKDSIKGSLLTNKRNQVYNNWLRAEKKNLDIVDLRHKIF